MNDITEFKINRSYKHPSGKMMHICNEIESYTHGKCLIAECFNGKIPIEYEPVNRYGIDNWKEIPNETFLLNAFVHKTKEYEELKKYEKLYYRKLKIKKIFNI